MIEKVDGKEVIIVNGRKYYQISSTFWSMDSRGNGKPLKEVFKGGNHVLVTVHSMGGRSNDAVLQCNSSPVTRIGLFGFEYDDYEKYNIALLPGDFQTKSYSFELGGPHPIGWDIRLGKGEFGTTCLWVEIYSSESYYYRRKK